MSWNDALESNHNSFHKLKKEKKKQNSSVIRESFPTTQSDHCVLINWCLLSNTSTHQRTAKAFQALKNYQFQGEKFHVSPKLFILKD